MSFDLKQLLIESCIRYRNAHGLSQSDFADLLGIKEQMIVDFETSRVDPKLSFMTDLLKVMNRELCIKDKAVGEKNNKTFIDEHIVDLDQEIQLNIERLIELSSIEKRDNQNFDDFLKIVSWFALELANWSSLFQYSDYMENTQAAINKNISNIGGLSLDECLATLLCILRSQNQFYKIKERLQSGDIKRLVNQLQVLIK